MVHACISLSQPTHWVYDIHSEQTTEVGMQSSVVIVQLSGEGVEPATHHLCCLDSTLDLFADSEG